MWVIAKPRGTRIRMGRSRLSSAPRQVSLIGPGSSVETHADAADRELVAEAQRNRPVDAMAVDVRPVRASLVLDEPAAAAEGEHRVVAADEVVLDVDRVVHVATERVDRSEGDRGAGGRLIAGRLEHGEPADSRARGDLRLLGVAQVLEERAREAHERQVEKGDESELEEQEEDPQDVTGQERTWNSIWVSPIRMMSPGPSAIWLTGCPFTVEPFRLPRSVKP